MQKTNSKQIQQLDKSDDWEGDTIPTYDRATVRVLGIWLVVGFPITLLQSSFIGTKSVRIASVRIVWCTLDD